MSSRQEEKERRRREREEQERQAASQAARSRRLQIVGGVVVGVVVIAVAIVLAVGSGGGGGDGGSGGPSATAAADVALPARKIGNLQAAVKAAGCTYRSYPIEGRTHTTQPVTYATNPPTSGNHNPVPAEDGVYAPGETPAKEHYVHTLEHGRVELQYRPGASRKTIDTLEAVYNEPVNGTPGYHALVFQNNTNMKAPIAATAWGQMLTCNTLSSPAIDALRDFREQFTDKGPEFIP
jgi:Protein of unknown function (DUF3105)